jgi:hypothetical protein
MKTWLIVPALATACVACCALPLAGLAAGLLVLARGIVEARHAGP